MQTMFVVNIDLFSCNRLCQGRQSFLIAEAVIGLTLVDQLLRVFHIKSGLLAIALYIWTDSAVLIRSLVVEQTCFFQGAVNDLNSSLNIALLIGIFDSENKVSAFMLCYQICV